MFYVLIVSISNLIFKVPVFGCSSSAVFLLFLCPLQDAQTPALSFVLQSANCICLKRSLYQWLLVKASKLYFPPAVQLYICFITIRVSVITGLPRLLDARTMQEREGNVFTLINWTDYNFHFWMTFSSLQCDNETLLKVGCQGHDKTKINAEGTRRHRSLQFPSAERQYTSRRRTAPPRAARSPRSRRVFEGNPVISRPDLLCDSP